MGKRVITTPDDKLQPLLWDWDGLVELKGNALFHCIMQHKRENYSVAKNRDHKIVLRMMFTVISEAEITLYIRERQKTIPRHCLITNGTVLCEDPLPHT